MTADWSQHIDRPGLGRGYRLILFALFVVTGAIHLWVMPEHFEEWWGYGSFFAVVGIAQVLSGLLWLRVRADWPLVQWLAILGILGNLALLGLYGVTRALGIPLVGPEAGEIESLGTIDVASKIIELSLVVLLIFVLRDLRSTEKRQPS